MSYMGIIQCNKGHKIAVNTSLRFEVTGEEKFYCPVCQEGIYILKPMKEKVELKQEDRGND